MKKFKLAVTVMTLGLALSACGTSGNANKKSSSSESSTSTKTTTKSQAKISGLTKDKNPKYKVGSCVKMSATHMAGMKGAKATIVGVYQTKLYEVNFKSTKTDKMVKNHKWITKNELGGDHESYHVGEKITLLTNHMAGMEGAHGTITAVNSGPAYMVNFTPTTGGKMVKNHKWLAQDELYK